MFEPNAPPIQARVDALDELARAGVRTYAMIAPILPGAGLLPRILAGKVRYVLVDRMNYNYADWVYRKYGLQGKLSDDYFCQARKLIYDKCTELGLECRLVC